MMSLLEMTRKAKSFHNNFYNPCSKAFIFAAAVTNNTLQDTSSVQPAKKVFISLEYATTLIVVRFTATANFVNFAEPQQRSKSI